jgi:hypothetical protein
MSEEQLPKIKLAEELAKEKANEIAWQKAVDEAKQLPPYEPVESSYLVKLADDILSSRVYCTWHADKHHDLAMSFMGLIFLGDIERAWMIQEKITFLYEDVSKKAGPRVINGHPTFLSFRFLNIGDEEKLAKIYNKLREQKEQLLAALGAEDNGQEEREEREEKGQGEKVRRPGEGYDPTPQERNLQGGEENQQTPEDQSGRKEET